MFSAEVIRKKHAQYPQKFAEINAEFLPIAGFYVEGEAKLRVPVDSGLLRSSITNKVETDRVIIGANTDYATHVEYGTRRMEALPYMRPSVDENRTKLIRMYRDIFRRVFSRGSK